MEKAHGLLNDTEHQRLSTRLKCNRTGSPTAINTWDWIAIAREDHGCEMKKKQALMTHLKEFQHHECPCKRFAIDTLGDHLHCCTQHVGATSAHTSTSLPCSCCSPRRDTELNKNTCRTSVD